MTEYEALLRRLLPARRFGIVLGLTRMRALLDALGAPDRRMGRVVQVGGTNGKGSTVAMIAALCQGAGLRVATYTSPHLACLRERVMFDGAMIDEAAICAAAHQVRLAGGDEFTFFEQLTAIACVAIAAHGADLTVLEVGLGGRLDATTAIAAEVAVVTGVAMDHEAILGDTLAKIAAEKAGIFERGQRVVIGASGEAAAVPVLVRAAEEVGASVVTVIDEASIARVPPVSLPGDHQRLNAAAALAAVAQLGLAIDPAALARVVHPGRFERIREARLPDGTALGDVILDGAHNPHGAAALAFALDRPVTLIVGTSSDKDIAGIAAALAPKARHVIATRYQQDRALAPELLAAHFASAETAPDLASALRRAAVLGGPIVVAGSLFLVGEARVLLLGAPADPVWVSDPPASQGGQVAR